MLMGERERAVSLLVGVWSVEGLLPPTVPVPVQQACMPVLCAVLCPPKQILIALLQVEVTWR